MLAWRLRASQAALLSTQQEHHCRVHSDSLQLDTDAALSLSEAKFEAHSTKYPAAPPTTWAI